MKIGFFTDCYLPAGFGVGTSIETFRKSLENLGHEIYIFAPFYKGYKDTNPKVFRFRSLKVIEGSEMRLASPFLPVNSFKEINRLKFDIIHAHTPFTLGFLGKYIASRHKIPLLYTHHTQYPDYAKFYLKEKILLPYLAQVVTTWFSNFSDAVIAPSYKIKKLLREYDVKKTIYILPTGIDTDIFKESPKERKNLREKLDVSFKTKLLLFVGRIGKEKNIEFLINMFKNVLEKSKIPVNLLIVGDGPYLEYFQQLSQKLKINSFIKFTGSVPYKEMPKYYQGADIFVFSSLTDTQGIVILEAMACGLPVVALKDNAFKNIVINNKNSFLINPEDNKKEQNIFAQKVLGLLNNPLLYKKFSNNSRQIAQQFSEKKQAKKLLEIYRTLIGKNKKKL